MSYGKISLQKRKLISYLTLFLNTFLRNFHSNFPLIKKTKINKIHAIDTGWVTPRTKHLCSLKRDLYLLTKNHNDIKIMNYYKFVCNTLAHTIKGTKTSYYSTKINLLAPELFFLILVHPVYKM